MKKPTLIFTFIIIVLTSFAQRKSTTVRGYYRKDGTYVSSHTRHYNSGGSSSSSSYYTSGASPSSNYLTSRSFKVSDSNYTISKSDLKSGKNNPNKPINRIGNSSINPSTLASDISGVTIYLAVLRYNDTSVVDICPLPRNSLTYEFQTSSLYYKIPKGKIKPEHIAELVSRYGFDLQNDYLLKREYLGVAKPDFPNYLSLKLEALTLK